jgi:nucleoside-diphosphate-sugar epimerase
MAYLVTGGTGSIGAYVVRDLLNKGKEVVCFQRSGVTPFLRNLVGEDRINRIKIIQGDIGNTQQAFSVIGENHIDTVIHLSALTSGGGLSESQPAYTLYVNCVGMNNILEAGRLFGLRRIVWTSSFHSVGEIGKFYKEPIFDSAIYKPDSMYSATKALNEFMTKLYYEKFTVDVLGFRIGAILNVYKSMGRGGIFTQFLKNAAMELPVVMAATDAKQLRPLGYVENVSDLLLKACECTSPKTRILNAAEYIVNCQQIVDSISRVNPKAKVTIKDRAAEDEATWGGTVEPIIDASGIRKELGWEPKYTLDEALKRVFNYFRQQAGMELL